jgi:UrcA family protein
MIAGSLKEEAMKTSGRFRPLAGAGRVSRLLLVSAIAFATHSPNAGSAESRPLSIVVGYSDLNLSESPGVAILWRRILRAAERVCGEQEVREISIRAAHQECVRNAAGRAFAQVGMQGE